MQKVAKIFRVMDTDKDGQVTFEEFVKGSKSDPSAVQVGVVSIRDQTDANVAANLRFYRCTMAYR